MTPIKREDVRSTVPEGSAGPWRIEKFTVTEDEIKIFNMRCMYQPGGHNRMMKPGTYTRLMRGGTVVMSDTPAEVGDHMVFIGWAEGNVLINGLGLGMCVEAVLKKPEVTHVTVIEKSEDVIALVHPHLKSHGDRLTVIHADAFEWSPPKGVRYDYVWHDIWDDICSDNLPDMHRLHRKYGRRCGWQGSWCRGLCEEAKRRW